MPPPKPDADIIDFAFESRIIQLYNIVFDTMLTAQYDQDKVWVQQYFVGVQNV